MTTGTITLTEAMDVYDLPRGLQAVYGLGGDDMFNVIHRGFYSAMLIDGGAGIDSLARSDTLILGDGITFANMEVLDAPKVKITSGATVDLSDFETSHAGRIVGSAGNETIIGTQDADTIHTGRGDDIVEAGAGDMVRMGSGHDTLRFVQDGTAQVEVNARGHGTITYGNGDVITFWSVESFEEIIPPTTYVLDFNNGLRLGDGDATLVGDFVAHVSQGEHDIQGLIMPYDYEQGAGDPDLEAFNSWGATVGFSRADGDVFDFARLSLANTSKQVPENIPEYKWANSVEITGYNDGVAIASRSIDLTFEHVVHDLGFEGIDYLEIRASGGGISNGHVQNAGWFSMDDLTFIA